MKKSIAWLMILVMVLGLLSGCKQETNTPKPTETQGETVTPDATGSKTENTFETVNPGKLTVVTCADFAPYAFYAADEDANSVLAGFDIAIAQYIADYYGLQLEILLMEAEDISAELGAGNADIALAGFTADTADTDAMALSDVYYEDKQCLIVGAEAKEYASVEDINRSGKKIGVLSASVQYDLAAEAVANAAVVELTTVAEVIDALCKGKVDGAVVEMAVANTYIADGAELSVLAELPYDTQPAVIGVAKENAALLEAVNKAVEAACNNGAMDRFVVEAMALTPQ